MSHYLIALLTEQAYDAGFKDISDLHKRSSLLSAHSKQCANVIQAYKELTMQLKNRLDNYHNLERYFKKLNILTNSYKYYTTMYSMSYTILQCQGSL
jgi:hypothetical protein